MFVQPFNVHNLGILLTAGQDEEAELLLANDYFYAEPQIIVEG